MLGQLSQFNCTWARSQRYVLFVFLRSTRCTFHLTQFICMEYLIFSFSIFMSSITGRRSNLSTQNKITPYKTIIKPVWTYGIQLWGTASNSDIEILQRFQLKRKAKAKWQKHRTCENKKHLNKLGKEIKSKIRYHNNNEFSKFIESLSAH